MNVQSDTKVDKIFKATFELIAKNGIHNTPMSVIGKKSGVATGTIYHYFESKEVLINALYLSLKQDMIANIMQGYEHQKPYKDSFFRIWLNYYKYLVGNPDILSFIEQCTNTPIISDETKQKAEAMIVSLVDFFTFGIENGIIKLTSIHLIISLIHGSVVSLAKLQISGQLFVTEEVKLSVAEYCWKGLT